MSPRPPSRICLNFHGIGTPARTLEPGEAPYWIGEEFFLQVLDAILALPDPARILLSFDDGNASDHTLALPALRARGLRARFFVLAGRIGQRGSLDAEQIRALQAAGMEIGSHGLAHLRWDRLPPAALREELQASRARLEEICEHPVRAAGIPFGAYNARVLRALRAAGYESAWSSDGGPMHEGAFLRPRTSLRSDMTLPQVQALMAGSMGPARRLRRRLGMLRKRLL